MDRGRHLTYDRVDRGANTDAVEEVAHDVKSYRRLSNIGRDTVTSLWCTRNLWRLLPASRFRITRCIAVSVRRRCSSLALIPQQAPRKGEAQQLQLRLVVHVYLV